KKLVYELQIAQSVRVQQNSLVLGSVFQIDATARPGHTAEELEKSIDAELQAFRQSGPQQSEVDRARNVIETRIVQGLENLGGFGGVADRLNMYNHYLGDPGYLPKDIQRYRDVTVADLKRVANQELTPQKSVIVYGVPGKKVIDDPPRTKEEQEQESKE